MELSRSQFVDIIERSIPQSMEPRDADALRRIARSTTRVARGTWLYEDCGCPAVQAGLFSGDPKQPEPFGTPVHAFTITYDDRTRSAHRGQNPCGAFAPNVIEVVD